MRVSLVVVDNGPEPLADAKLQALWSGVRVIRNAINRGLAPAANQGARAATGDILLFLNPDTRARGEPFSEIARAFREHREAAAVAPRLVDLAIEAPRAGRLAAPEHEDQFTFQLRRLPRIASDARQLFLIDHLLPNNPGRRRDRYADCNREESFFVEQAAGAALAVRKAAFEAVGGFDERFVPAWFEDVDLCGRLASQGTILYWPHAAFEHGGGAASRELGYARFLPIYYRNALAYRQPWTLASRLLYRAMLAVGMLLRLAALPIRPAVPRPRAEAARAYVRVLGLALGFGPRLSGSPSNDSPDT